MGGEKGERRDRISCDKITIYVVIVRRLIINPLRLRAANCGQPLEHLFGKRSLHPLGNFFFRARLCSVFSPFMKKKKKKKQKARTKEQTLNNFILDRSRFPPTSATTQVFHERTSNCVGKETKEGRKKKKKKGKKRHVYIDQPKVLLQHCIEKASMHNIIHIRASVHLRWRSVVALMLIPKAVPAEGCGGARDCSCGSSCQRLVTVTPD